MSRNIAVFIDADNIAANQIATITALAAHHGPIALMRAYGCAQSLATWGAIPAVQFVFAGNRSNAADFLLTVDAMECCFTLDAATYLICTSDSDLAHLARRLRERGKRVIGYGNGQTPEDFRAACTLFETLSCAVRPAPAQIPRPTDLDLKLRSLISQHGIEGKGARLNVLGALMSQYHGVKCSDLPTKNWRSYIESRAAFFLIGTQGPNAMVRLKDPAFVAAGTKPVCGIRQDATRPI